MLRRSILRQTRELFISATSSSYAFSSSSSSFTKPPPRKANQSVRRILHLLSSSPSQTPTLNKVLQTLKASPTLLTPSDASTLISAIKDPLISFNFYRYLKATQPAFKPNLALFDALITSQLQSLNPHLPKIKIFFQEMEKYEVSLPHDDFRGFLRASVPNHFEIAEFFVSDVLEKMQFEEDLYSFVVSVYSDHGFLKEAVLVGERARERCSNLSLEFYCCVMGVYRKNGDAEAAMKLYLDMEERAVRANEEIYRILLDIFCRVGWVKLCLVIVEEMVKAGYKVDECLSLKMLRRFIREGMVSEAENLFREGVIRGNESLGVLVEVMAQKGKPSVGLELIKVTQKSQFDVYADVYASLIRRCGKLGLISDAEKIFYETKSYVKNKEVVYSSMIFVYSQAKMKSKAEMVWDEMKVINGFGRSEEAFMCMMSMYGLMGLVEDAIRLFDEWKHSYCKISTEAYAVLVDALSKSGRLNQARDILSEMRREGIPLTNTIYASLLEGYLRVGLMNHAIALVNEHTKLGFEADEVVGTSVVKILIQSGRFSELESYLDKLASRGIKFQRGNGELLMQMCRDEHCLRKIMRLM